MIYFNTEKDYTDLEFKSKFRGKLKKDTNNWAYFFNAFLIVLLMIFGIGFNDNNIVSPEVGVILLVLFLFQPLYIKVQTIFLLIPFQTALVVNQNISLFSIIELIFVLSLLIKKGTIKTNQLLILVWFFSLQLLSSIVYNSSIIDIISLIITFLLIALLTEYFRENKKDLFAVYAKSLVLGIFMASIIAIIPNIDALSIGRFAGLLSNPNRLGMHLLVAISLLITLFFEKKINIIILLPSLIILFYFTVLTQSRSTIFAAVILLIVVLIVRILTDKKSHVFERFLKIVGTLSVFLIISYCIYLFVMQPIIQERGIISSDEDFSAGRLTLIKENYSWIIQEKNGTPFVLGFGINNNIEYMKSNDFITSGTHNTFTEMFISLGVFGFSLWLFFLKDVYKSMFRFTLNYRIFFVYILLYYTFTGHLNTSSFLYITLTLTTFLNYNVELKENKQLL